MKAKTPKKGNFSFKGCKVLVADDNTINRTILCAMLASEDIQYVEVADGEAAVQAYIDAPDNAFNCILIDMRMPKLDGIKATQKIRDSKRPDASSIPIIAVSANGFAEDIKKAKQAGVNSYTTKPIDKEQLLDIMASLISKD